MSKNKIEVRNITALPGQVTRGFLRIGETASGPIQLPVVLINGEGDGPVLCLTSGVHATEYAPIEAVMRLTNDVSPQTLRGAIIAIPVVSMNMFAGRCGFVSPIDGLNLNKIAPGGDGSISEILVRVLLDEVIAKAQYHIDLHAGDFGEMLMPFAGYSLTGNSAVDHEGEALARLFTPGLISLSRSGDVLPPFPGSIVHTAARRGIVAILAESGGNGTLEEADVRLHLEGVTNIMRYLKMMDGEPMVHGPQFCATGRAITRAKHSGLLRLHVKIGDVLAAGQAVAEICDVFGQTLETVRVAKAGTAGLVWSHKVVSTGDPVVRCWYTDAAGDFPATDKFMQLPREVRET
jgi:predicted deacylase